MSIPVIGLPVLNNRELTDRFIRSIDYPVELLYVIDNGNVIPHDMHYKHLPDIHVVDLGYNAGVAASWNLTIRANMRCMWWAFANNDVVLEKGAAAKLALDMEENIDIPNITMVEMGNESWGNHFGFFGVNDLAIEEVGWFDENFHPIYFEDTDWKRRAERAGIRMHVIKSTTHHDGNASWKSDNMLAFDNKRSWDYNRDYFDDKWGVAEPDLKSWRPPSLSRLRNTAWNVDRSGKEKA
jgi:GT2 family glycosyltransferase